MPPDQMTFSPTKEGAMLRWSTLLILIVPFLTGYGCDSSKSQGFCNSAVEKGLLDDSVDCSDEKWQSATTCEECLYILEQDYQLAITDPAELCDEHFGNYFLKGALRDPCDSTVGICQTAAGCALEEDMYIRGSFPGFVSFAVSTQADTTIAVKLFFVTQRHPGEDTEITWFETGCNDFHRYESQGADLFDLAGGDKVFEQEYTVVLEGAHLIEIYCDASTYYYLRVETKQ
jgi:hypothetical protein